MCHTLSPTLPYISGILCAKAYGYLAASLLHELGPQTVSMFSIGQATVVSFDGAGWRYRGWSQQHPER